MGKYADGINNKSKLAKKIGELFAEGLTEDDIICRLIRASSLEGMIASQALRDYRSLGHDRFDAYFCAALTGRLAGPLPIGVTDPTDITFEAIISDAIEFADAAQQAICRREEMTAPRSSG